MKRTVVYIGAAAILFFVWWILSSFLELHWDLSLL